MPIKPRPGEDHDEFVSRCMSEENESIPDQDQRLAACFDMWRRERGEAEAEADPKEAARMQAEVIELLANRKKAKGATDTISRRPSATPRP